MPWNVSQLPERHTRAQFHALALRLARDAGADLLLSGAGFSDAHRSLCGLEPVEELVVEQNTDPGRIKDFCFGAPGPVLGWLAYDLGLRLRGVASAKPRTLPLGLLRRYATVLEHDALTGGLRCLGRGVLPAGLTGRSAAVREHLPVLGRVHASLDAEGYCRAVREVLCRIRAGHSYQLNLSIRFEAATPGMRLPDNDGLGWFARLLRRNPAPFYAWFGFGAHRLLSTSPERFLRVRGGEVLTQPIKGTLRLPESCRGPELERLAEQLRATPKEDAELSMIVDLLRNDVSTHCDYGSVRVARHKHVFRVDRLLQMQSDVTGRLRPGADCLDLLLDAFPGGSVTGCPKRRSLRIMDELEPHAREIYCGSFVCIEDERNMDSSVAIRTAHLDAGSGLLRWYAGSGIVVDSVPEAEYRETLAKAEKFLEGSGQDKEGGHALE